jgi:hypothetical protein
MPVYFLHLLIIEYASDKLQRGRCCMPLLLCTSPQVALYALAALAQQQQQQPDWPGSFCSSRRQQKQQQQPDCLPSLPPVALVRLPGKVSSIAWSPDMDGVMSIGDYDGTLTQVCSSCVRLQQEACGRLHDLLRSSSGECALLKLWRQSSTPPVSCGYICSCCS